MPRLRCSLSVALAAALLGLASACHADEAPAADPGELPELGIMGTIPLYWGEAGDFGEVLAGQGSVHWARAQLEADYRLEPLDTLDADSLGDLDFLLLAQPRALSPAENVALDDWVRHGGRVLVFADPLMTGESRFAIGDRRRPQDVVLLSPILTHWGLSLAFDEDQPTPERMVPAQGATIPVNLPGVIEVADEDTDHCRIIAGDVLASCAIGSGRAVVLADAAVLDLHQPHPAAARALNWLIGVSFDQTGDGAGRSGERG
jgi:hypothetical protein